MPHNFVYDTHRHELDEYSILIQTYKQEEVSQKNYQNYKLNHLQQDVALHPDQVYTYHHDNVILLTSLHGND